MEEEALQTLVAEVASKELGEDQYTRPQGIQQLRAWILKHPDITNCRTDDNFLLRFLRNKKYSVALAQQNLIKFLESFQKFDYLKKEFDVLDPAIDFIVSSGHMYTSPYRDNQGRQVTIIQINSVRPDEVSYQDVARQILIHVLVLMEDEASQVVGHVFLLDARGTGLSHATFWPPMELQRLLEVYQHSLPLRYKEIHILNINPLMKTVFDLVLYVCAKKFKDRVYMHTSLEDLHKKVSPKVLPKEYGGTMSTREMIDQWKEHQVSKRKTVLGFKDIGFVNKAVDIELGSFRQLNVD